MIFKVKKRILIAVMVFALGVNTAHACIGTFSDKHIFDSHSHVLAGTISECVKEDDRDIKTIHVEKIWKGEEARYFRIIHPCDDAMFQVGKRYLVYARWYENVQGYRPAYGWFGVCGRSSHVIQPKWLRNIKGFYIGLKAGLLKYAFMDLFSQREDLVDTLGKPKYEFK